MGPGRTNHQGPVIRKFLSRNRRLWLEWSWLQFGKLSTFVPDDVRELDDWEIEYRVRLKCDAKLS